MKRCFQLVALLAVVLLGSCTGVLQCMQLNNLQETATSALSDISKTVGGLLS